MKILMKNGSVVTERIYPNCPVKERRGRIVSEKEEGAEKRMSVHIVYEYEEDSCCRGEGDTCTCPPSGQSWHQFPSFEVSDSCDEKTDDIEKSIGTQLMEAYGLSKMGCVRRKRTRSKWYVNLNEHTMILDDEMSVTVKEGESIFNLTDSDLGSIKLESEETHVRVKREAQKVNCDYLADERSTTMELSTPSPVDCDYHKDMTTTMEQTTTEQLTTTTEQTTTVEQTTTAATDVCDYFEDFTSTIATTTQEITTTIEPTTETTTIETTTMDTTTMDTTTMETTTMEATTMEATTIQTTSMEATTIEVTTMEDTTLQATTMEATTVEATTMEGTTLHATTIEATTEPTTTMDTSSMQTTRESNTDITTTEPTTKSPTTESTTQSAITDPSTTLTSTEIATESTTTTGTPSTVESTTESTKTTTETLSTATETTSTDTASTTREVTTSTGTTTSTESTSSSLSLSDLSSSTSEGTSASTPISTVTTAGSTTSTDSSTVTTLSATETTTTSTGSSPTTSSSSSSTTTATEKTSSTGSREKTSTWTSEKTTSGTSTHTDTQSSSSTVNQSSSATPLSTMTSSTPSNTESTKTTTSSSSSSVATDPSVVTTSGTTTGVSERTSTTTMSPSSTTDTKTTSTAPITTTSSALETTGSEILFCDRDSATGVTSTPSTTSESTTTKRCVPSMFTLNISNSEINPTVVVENHLLVGSNLPMSCLISSFEWTVNSVVATANSPHSLNISLEEGRVAHVCLKLDDKGSCGYVKYVITSSTTSSSPTTTTTVSPTTTSTLRVTFPMDPALKIIHDEIENFITDRRNGTNGTNLIEDLAKMEDPKAFIDTLTKVLQGQLDLKNGLSTEEVIEMMKKYMNTDNDDVAKAMAILIGKLSNMTITDPDTLNSILSTLDAALKGSLSYSLVGDGKSLANVFGVIFGTIKGPKVNLMSAKCTARVQGNVIYVKGDIRSAKYQDENIPITLSNYVRKMSTVRLQAIGFTAVFPASPFENYTIAGKRQLFKVIGNTQMVVGSGMDEPEDGLSLWNCTFDPLGDESQTLKNMTFTSWAGISSATLVLPQTSSTLNSLRLGEIVPSTSLTITANFNNETKHLNYLGGKLQLMEMNANYVSFSVSGGSFNPSPDLMTSTVIVDPLRIEGISTDMLRSMDSQKGKSEARMEITPAKGYTLMLITGFNDVPPLPLTENATDSIVKASFQAMDKTMSKSALENSFVAGNNILVEGEMTTELTGKTVYNNVSLIYDGNRILVEATGVKLIIEDAKWKASFVSSGNNGQITISGGYVMETGLDHTQTILELSETSRIIIDHGTIIRNATDGYVIMNGQITKIGDEGGDLKITQQSLMNQDAQKEIIKILDNTADFLLLNGKNMSKADIDTVAKSLLSIFGSINKAIADALANPLASDLAKNLAREKANYDDIFNSLPYDSSKIRYVEEYTQEEWAAEATRLVQQQIARQMAAQMERLMGILEDTLVARMTTLPDSVSYEEEGNSMVVTVGRAADILKQDFMCTDWTVVFPERVEYLNTKSIDNDTLIRVSLICYALNPYSYVDNAAVLVSSGALSASLKTLEGTVIAVNQTTDPISITGRGGGNPAGSTLVLTNNFLSYQILDVHTFHTIQWNSSVVIEIYPTMIFKETDNSTELWAFVGFQRLPGPHNADHDFRFKIDKNRKSSLFISSWDLFNRTGLFYVGMGIRSLSDEVDSTIVQYPTPTGVEGSWNFFRSLDYDYRLRAITKGCFFFIMDTERWDSSGIRTGVYVGDTTVQCLTYHMTYYASGIYTPEVPSDFDYTYVEQSFPKSSLVLLSIILIFFHQSVVTWMANRHTLRDQSKSQLHVMADNHPLDTYKYILAVDTGYNMFATTDSQVHVNIVGEEWQAFDRVLIGEEETGRSLKWGTTERFLLTSKYSLGQLKYLSLWIDSVGLQHRESWFCKRVVVYDLQTREEFLFEVDNWLGTQNGDGQTERTVGASKKRPFFLREAFWWHRISENIAYIAMYTGGGTLWRLRVSRQIQSVSVYIALFVVSFINIRVSEGEDFSRLPSFEKNVFGFYFSIRDLVLGLIYSFLLLPITIAFPVIFARIKSDIEEIRIWKLRRIDNQREFVEPRGLLPFAIKVLSFTIIFFIAFVLVLISVHASFSMNEDMQNAFVRRFYVMLACWIIVTEPLKALIITSFYCICRREHYYINRYEKSFMKILPKESYGKAPPSNDDAEKTAKLANSKSQRSEDQRMRDEQLFDTARQVITFFLSIFILLGLTYFCRDRFGFFYQQEVNNLFSINGNPYDGKSFQGIQTIDNFYKWTINQFVPALRVSWYDSKPAWNMRGFMNDKTSRSMGYGIIRQVRSKSGVDCKLVDDFSKYFDSCEGYSGLRYEDKTEAYTVGWVETTTKDSNFTRQEYTYRSAKELQGTMIIGNMDYYSGGGYAWDIVGTATDLANQMRRLEKEGWVDENTRAIVIEFSMYNAQVNYFAVIQLVLENPPDGALYPSAWIETVRLMKYVGDDGKYVRTFEALYVGFTIVNCIAEIYELSRVGFNVYLSTFWHLLGLLVVVCSAFSLYAYGLRYVAMEEAMNRFIATNGNTYIRLDSQRDLELYFTWLIGFVVFAVSIKMIRILKFNRRISVLALTLEKSASSMAGFALVYVLINAAFDSALYTLLYSKLLNYRNFLAVTEATTASLLGKFSVTDVLAASTLGSVMFMVFMMTGTIVLVNMFVMIVMYEFESVRNDKDNQTNEYEVVQHISSKLLQTMGLYERSDNPNTAFPNYLEQCSAVEQLEKQLNLLDLLVDNVREVEMDDLEEAKKGEYQKKAFFPN